MLQVLDRLAGPGGTEDDLATHVLEVDGPSALPVLYYCLQTLRRRCLVRYAVHTDSGLLARATPTSGGPLVAVRAAAQARFRLSRFALMRRERQSLLLESPLTAVDVELPTPLGAALVAALVQPHSASSLAATCPPTTAAEAAALLELLAAAGVVAALSDAGTTPEDDHASLPLWEFHDLLFHSRVRQGRHARPYGATFPWRDRLAPLPALRHCAHGEVLELPRPDLGQLADADRPFSRVLEERRSVRQHGREPITREQLGELLFRALRVREVTLADDGQATSYDVSDRPYPSAGAGYDLEAYLTVRACTGVAAGLYHYDPRAHQLRRVSGSTAETASLLEDARRAAALEEPPQVLITLASRFGRMSWKYASIAHALTLKNVGVLQQTLYLVATAMGLAPCALGGGNSDTFATAAGTDYYAESSVGEFIVGSREVERHAATPN